jgi:2'-5' RNA ligase
MSLIRTFIAAPLPCPRPLETIRQQLGAMRSPVKLMPPDQLHITLAFLGDTDESLVPQLAAILTDVVATEPATELVLHGLGAFPRISEPTVVWVGFADSSPLIRLADALWRKLQQLGFRRESRPFHPHLTLARIKSTPPAELASFIRDRITADFGAVSLSQLEFFRSDLLPQGPQYTVLSTARLRQTDQ